MKVTERGMTAWSLAGHDKGKLYVIVKVDEEYVWLSDGRLRPLENPKKKKWKHVQVRKQIPEELQHADWNSIKNEEIKHCVKELMQEADRR
jgi:ribosomal protein L14E/L6E/L27E